MALSDIVRYLNARQRVRHGFAPDAPDALEVVGGRAQARFAELTLDSAFQPIFDLGRGRVVAHEALLRARSTRGAAVPPEQVFARPRGSEELVYLDRLSRTVHALNFVEQNAEKGALYLNVDPRHLLAAVDHGLVFESILRHIGIPPEEVVLEILESAIDDLSALRVAIGNFRSRGFRIAIDDFGRGHANFDRLWELRPEVVKFDRHLLVTADRDHRVRAVLSKLVDVAKAHTALVLFEGVETEEQLEIVRESGADLAQGFHLGRPAADIQLRRSPSERARAERASEPPKAVSAPSAPASGTLPKAPSRWGRTAS